MPAFLRNFDWGLFGAMFLLIGVGLISLWSLSPGEFFLRQLLWIGIGLAAVFILASLDYRIFRNHGGVLILLLIAGVLLLSGLLIFGPKTRGVAGWFRIGTVAVEPVEFIKLLLVLILAKYFSRRHIEIYQVRHLLVSGVYMCVPVLLVLLQPDLGSAIILVAIWILLVVFSGIRFRHLAGAALLFLICFSVAWFFVLAPYQKQRITTFFDPYRDPRGAGYNVIQSMIAVGSGGVVGKGIGYGTQSHLNFLPEPETDFIFAAFAEETGFVGGVLFLIFLFFFLWRGLRIGRSAHDNFSKLFVLGFSALVFFQSSVHIGINLGILPVTGITLPFVSYGGSSLLSLMAGVGILESIRIHSRSDIME